MTEAQVRAIFLLAGFEVTSLTKIPNPYWPKHPDYREVSENSPWWLVYTPRGFIEIGWRKRVISIEWAGMGVVFPFNDQDGRDNHNDKHFTPENVTNWETGTHAYGYGMAVQYLIALQHSLGRFDYLKQYWKENPPPTSEMIEWEIAAKSAHWTSNVTHEHIRVIITAKTKTDAIMAFYEKYPEHRESYCHPRLESVKCRSDMGLEEPELVG